MLVQIFIFFFFFKLYQIYHQRIKLSAVLARRGMSNEFLKTTHALWCIGVCTTLGSTYNLGPASFSSIWLKCKVSAICASVSPKLSGVTPCGTRTHHFTSSIHHILVLFRRCRAIETVNCLCQVPLLLWEVSYGARSSGTISVRLFYWGFQLSGAQSHFNSPFTFIEGM